MTAAAAEALVVVEMACDGACIGNPGPGGWGVLLRMRGAQVHEKELSGGAPATTNNRMELCAAIEGLRALTKPCRVTVITDSQYVIKGITTWVFGWKRNGWRTSSKGEVVNRDLWEQLLAATQGHELTWKWVKGHSGHADNERVDQLAQAAAEQQR